MSYDPAEIYGAWLDEYSWDTFATLTFRTQDYGSGPVPPTLKKCRAATEKALRNNGFRRAFWGAERGYEGRWHVHTLLESQRLEALPVVSTPAGRRDTTLAAENLDQWWRKRYGLTRIERYLPARGAASYVSKYVSKQMSDYDLWLRRFS